MSGPGDGERFPRGALLAAGGLVLFALVAVTGARLAGFSGVAAVPEPAQPARWAATARRLSFEDRPDGTLRVSDAASGRVVADLEPGSGGFVRGMMRAMARHRRLQGAGVETPFLLSYSDNGRLVLEDPATDQRIAIDAFGASNLAAFAALLESPAEAAQAGAASGRSSSATGEST